jgi:hypothetical protein
MATLLVTPAISNFLACPPKVCCSAALQGGMLMDSEMPG